MRSKTKNAIRLISYAGLLCLELGLITAFYIFPQFQTYNAPAGHWEMETPVYNAPGAWIGLIAFSGLVALCNVGLVIMIWRELKALKVND